MLDRPCIGAAHCIFAGQQFGVSSLPQGCMGSSRQSSLGDTATLPEKLSDRALTQLATHSQMVVLATHPVKKQSDRVNRHHCAAPHLDLVKWFWRWDKMRDKPTRRNSLRQDHSAAQTGGKVFCHSLVVASALHRCGQPAPSQQHQQQDSCSSEHLWRDQRRTPFLHALGEISPTFIPVRLALLARER
jgi:hypothetical protein